jgi:endogenous inhibitor of DNA gyrase (YacG/DUF329 family)
MSAAGKPVAQRSPDPSKIAKGKCPICGEPTEYEARPFCSRRCANIDLYRWMSGGYAIAGREDADEDGDDASGEAASTPMVKRESDDADV